MDQKKLIGFSSYISNLVRSGYRTNAFAPLVWFNAISLPLLLFFGLRSDGVIEILLIGSAVFIIVFTLLMYLFLLIKDPKLLQSESYRLEDKKLDIIQEKGGSFLINPVDLTTPKEIAENKTVREIGHE